MQYYVPEKKIPISAEGIFFSMEEYNSKYRRNIFRSFISGSSFPEWVPFFLSICQMYLKFIQSTWVAFWKWLIEI